MCEDTTLKLYTLTMRDRLGNALVVKSYVAHSEEEARKRWGKEHRRSSLILEGVERVEKIDGRRIYFGEEQGKIKNI